MALLDTLAGSLLGGSQKPEQTASQSKPQQKPKKPKKPGSPSRAAVSI